MCSQRHGFPPAFGTYQQSCEVHLVVKALSAELLRSYHERTLAQIQWLMMWYFVSNGDD